MEFSRNSPSRKYRELLAHYRRMHADGYTVRDGDQSRELASGEAFPGRELLKFAANIKNLIVKYGARTILDYGAGKGLQYRPIEVDTGTEKFPDIASYWGVESVTCYDPAVPEFSAPPAGKSDGVVSTDVLEHCPAPDVPWIVDEMLGLAGKFLFVTIACYPAMARLPTGENAHVTIRSPEWWAGLFAGIANNYPEVDYLLCCVVPGKDDKGETEYLPTWIERERYD